MRHSLLTLPYHETKLSKYVLALRCRLTCLWEEGCILTGVPLWLGVNSFLALISMVAIMRVISCAADSCAGRLLTVASS